MHLTTSFLSLPASILLLIATHSSAQTPDPFEITTSDQWPYNLPPHVKFWPEDPPSRRRDLEAIEKHIQLGRKPVGVMKMSADEGEKFYMEYWQFEGELGQKKGLFESRTLSAARSLRKDIRDEDRSAGNGTAVVRFRPPFMLHSENPFTELELRARRALKASEKRDFTCPTGTSSCSGIGFPGSCCTGNERCFQITDTGLGPVGCCPAGASCGGVITTCDAPNTACSAVLGGGCCIPGFSCVEGGCALTPALVVTTVITMTFTVTASSTTRTSTSLSTVISTSATACPLGVQSCPASLGGGCCPTDRVCALESCAPSSSSSCSTSTSLSTYLTTTTSATGVAPVRPTSGTTTTSNPVPTTCPTGFYACQAYYEGGCCRTGRNCEKTSCPPTSSTTIVSSGVTIVVPVGSAAAVATPTGVCASGWSTCAASVGGNCCPGGWECGTASCSSVGAQSTAVQQKSSPGMGGRTRGDWNGVTALMVCGLVVVGIVLGI
ncbi:related to DAN4 Cell wall mannoprotein, expressed under anaerobic conditions, completely repressed during aerobic growth [Rhynchosporium secalis]|uniref:Related to DAN4 Cell wall mannoprotein, expressed under anaerobic conditions, completely repressed during aerobic growth n=1 Tax=Rhynchosporium secalis TaxID=38038 RepID=A0A1E1LXL6_RHYSE|nr:related to DAN4 Cell wall mannoprotein, expressed under anaerobic conditions, completely repressed during aerobic growth [Rhynchosporium secalis]